MLFVGGPDGHIVWLTHDQRGRLLHHSIVVLESKIRHTNAARVVGHGECLAGDALVLREALRIHNPCRAADGRRRGIESVAGMS